MAGKIERVTLFASTVSVISSIVASICCIGPLLFVFLGIGGFAFLAKFHQYDWLFGTLALGLLGLSFFFTYRSGEKCASGPSCAVNHGKRKFSKIILWTSTVLVVGFLISPYILAFLLKL